MKTVQGRRPFHRPLAENENPWGSLASDLIKRTLEEQGLGYADLAIKLGKLGVNLKSTTVNRKINRGNFSAGFLLMCLQALGVPRVELDELQSVTGIVGDGNMQPKLGGGEPSRYSRMALEEALQPLAPKPKTGK